MTRKDSWPEDFAAYLDSCSEREFAWGVHDCALFVCGAIEAMTGIDLAAEFRGQYRSALSAARLMKRDCEARSYGLEIVAERVAAEHGIPDVPKLCAQRGDVVIIHSPHQQFGPLGIVSLDNRFVITTAERGLTGSPLTEAARAWRI